MEEIYRNLSEEHHSLEEAIADFQTQNSKLKKSGEIELTLEDILHGYAANNQNQDRIDDHLLVVVKPPLGSTVHNISRPLAGDKSHDNPGKQVATNF